MTNKNNRLVVAYYPNANAAEAAAQSLKDWDKANDDIKLGAIAVLTLNPKSGEIEAHEVGQRETKSGALWGTAIGAAVGLLTGGIGLIPGLILGAAGGGAVGSLMHESVGMTDADRRRIVDTLRDGLVALAVMADDFEVDATMKKLLDLGGRTESYEVPVETAEALTAVAEVQTEAASAIDEAVSTVDESVEDVTRAVTEDLPDLAAESVAAVSGLVATLGLSAADAAKLSDEGIEKVSAFYRRAATPQGRDELAKATGLDSAAILQMEKKMDLMRVKGVGPKYADLLIASGVDSVPELGTRNPANLHAKMAEVNAAQQIVDEMPGESEVPSWVAQAKELPRVVVF